MTAASSTLRASREGPTRDPATAANGDTLVGTYDLNGKSPYAMRITGGTGRFDGATGAMMVTFQVGETGRTASPSTPGGVGGR